MAGTTERPWDGSASRFTIQEWKRACLIDTGAGDPDSKSRYKLPVREPDGTVNANGVRAAAARFDATEAPPAAKKRALATLNSLKRQLKIGAANAQ